MDELTYCILGLLLRMPSTGYELAKIIEGKLSHFYNIKYSQIYPELNKLKYEKLIDYFIDVRGKSLKRKRYYISPKGKEEFNRWINDIPASVIGPTSKILLFRLFFAEQQTLQKHIALAEAYRNESEDNLKRMEEILRSCFRW